MKSVLYVGEGATVDMDRILVSSLVIKNVAGGRSDDVFQRRCVEKIIQTITSNKWQQIYKSSHFIHILDIYNKEKIGDVKFMLMCQLMEILYFYRCNKNPANRLEKKFNLKLQALFLSIYDKNINEKTSNVIRILRNHVAHTGTLEKIKGVLTKRDVNAINGLKRKYKTKSLRSLAFLFNFLMEDILLRSIGLGDDELFRNGIPPQFLTYFKS